MSVVATSRKRVVAAEMNHLRSEAELDQAIVHEEDRLVAVRFGSDADPTCEKMDSALFECEDEVKELAAVFLVELSDVPELIKSNELYDPCTLMLYYKGRHVLVDIGTGPSTKITLAPRNQGDLVTVLKNAFDAAKMGRGLVQPSNTRGEYDSSDYSPR